MRRKAYSYIRMSSETQLKGDSLRRQLETSIEYAQKNDLELIESIDGKSLQDIGVSGFRGVNTQKGVLADFLNALDRGKIKPHSVLLIESLDRLSRSNLSEVIPMFINILNKDIEIVTLADNQKYTKEIINQNPGAMFISLGIMFRANEESEIKSKRLKAAWENKRNNIGNKVLTRTCPAWLKYCENTKQFIIIKENGVVVQKIFDLCINTCGLFGIARFLNENKFPVFGKGRLWYVSYVKKIITNRAVLGEFTPHKMINGKRIKDDEPIADYFPQLISEQTFLQAQVAIARRNLIGKGRKGVGFSNLFAGITFCGHCGFKMMVRARGGERQSSRYLACSNKLVKAGCEMTEWNLVNFESIVLDHLREINFSDLVVTYKPEEKISLDDQASILEVKIKQKEAQIIRATDFIFTSDLSTATKNRLSQKLNLLEYELRELQEQLDLVKQQSSSAAALKSQYSEEEFKCFLEQLKTHKDDYLYRSTVNNLLTKLIERIELSDGDKEFKPWEFQDGDEIVEAYRAAFKVRKKMSLSQLLSNSDFVTFSRNYQREITIRYHSGVVRHLMVGKNASLPVRLAK